MYQLYQTIKIWIQLVVWAELSSAPLNPQWLVGTGQTVDLEGVIVVIIITHWPCYLLIFSSQHSQSSLTMKCYVLEVTRPLPSLWLKIKHSQWVEWPYLRCPTNCLLYIGLLVSEDVSDCHQGWEEQIFVMVQGWAGRAARLWSIACLRSTL